MLVWWGVFVNFVTQIFDLNLDLGPYNFAYSRNGRHLMLGGRKGHLALMDWEKAKLDMEIQLRETIRDVTYVAYGTFKADLFNVLPIDSFTIIQ